MKQYIVDAFTNELFKGNQAAVCVLEKWFSDEMMLNIAQENNFSETAFLVKSSAGYDIRWFTPASEIDFCGHATLAASFVIFNFYERDSKEVVFHTKQKGDFFIHCTDNGIRMDFPSFRLNKIPVTDDMEAAFGTKPSEAYFDRDLLCVFDNADSVKNMSPSIPELKKLKRLCIGVTAQGNNGFDCISRVFAPELNVPEDPVTGSTHCMIAPYWAKRLGKNIINAFQASPRSGTLLCEVSANTVSITGNAVLFSIAELNLP